MDKDTVERVSVALRGANVRLACVRSHVGVVRNVYGIRAHCYNITVFNPARVYAAVDRWDTGEFASSYYVGACGEDLVADYLSGCGCLFLDSLGWYSSAVRARDKGLSDLVVVERLHAWVVAHKDFSLLVARGAELVARGAE